MLHIENRYVYIDADSWFYYMSGQPWGAEEMDDLRIDLMGVNSDP